MRCCFLILTCTLCLTVCYGQKVLVLETLKAGTVKQQHFYVKDRVKLRSGGKKHAGTLVAIGDSALLLYTGKKYDTVLVTTVTKIMFNRPNRITTAFSQAFLVAGLMLVTIDSFNNIINNEDEIVKPPVVIAGASLAGAGILVKLCEIRRKKIGNRNRLRVINLSSY